jgi:hypothetical protein
MRSPRPRLMCLAVVLCWMVGGAVSDVHAQPAAGSASRLAWDQAASDVGEAIGYIYEASYDGGAWERIPNVNCGNASSPFTCAGDFPPLTPATHTVRLRTVTVINTVRAESVPSEPFTFRFVALPSAPRNLRIVPGE